MCMYLYSNFRNFVGERAFDIGFSADEDVGISNSGCNCAIFLNKNWRLHSLYDSYSF